GRCLQQVHAADQGALAGSALADHAEDLPALDGQGDIVERGDGPAPVGEGLGQVFDRDHGGSPVSGAGAPIVHRIRKSPLPGERAYDRRRCSSSRIAPPELAPGASHWLPGFEGPFPPPLWMRLSSIVAITIAVRRGPVK